jgi:hypothetical protein
VITGNNTSYYVFLYLLFSCHVCGSNRRTISNYNGLLGPTDIVVLQKHNDTVQRIINGTIMSEPLLDVNVATSVERGMLGIAVSRNSIPGQIYVFLYYTEAESADGELLATI